MTWKQSWLKKREIPNRLKIFPTISFKSNLSPESANYIRELSKLGKKSKFINDAIEMKLLLDNYPKGFIVELVRNNFSLCKHIVRQIGKAFTVPK